MGMRRQGFLVGALLAGSSCAYAGTRPVPSTCTAQVNEAFARFVAASQSAGREAEQDNVMVCGTMVRNGYVQHAGHSGHGAHKILVISAPTAQGPVTMEVVTNNDLDGNVWANKGDAVFAYGQAFWDPGMHVAGGFPVTGGLHEPHCATHAGADDGWVVVAGKKYPPGTCSNARF